MSIATPNFVKGAVIHVAEGVVEVVIVAAEKCFA
jgi:hypothetical protein